MHVTLDVIAHHPYIGSGLGSFGVIYTHYDSRNGLYRLEQAHNDYLQILADAGIVGGLLGLSFLVLLFALFNRRKRTLHDVLSGMLMVRRAATLATVS